MIGAFEDLDGDGVALASLGLIVDVVESARETVVEDGGLTECERTVA